jgi:hypothetical protein
MAFIIQNRAKHLLVLPLNSGETLHLAPGETSSPVEDFEITNNERVDRLSTEGLIAVNESGAASSDDSGAAEVAPGDSAQAGGKERRRGSGRN